MKKIIISMFLIMAAGILVSCGKSKEEMDSYLVYYLNQDMTGLVEGTMESPHKKKDTNAVVADLLKSKPIYESLLENLLKKRSLPTPQGVGEKVLLDFMILHNSPLDNHLVKEIQWPNHCLIVSLRRDGQEFIPHGDTYLKASDSIIVMCDKIDESYIYDTLSALTTEQI